MQIVSQFALFSYSPFPALPAPRIAGLLPANVAPPPPPYEVLRRNDPTPPPFVSKDRAAMPPEILAIIGHLPAPDELEHWVNQRRAEVFDKLARRMRERAV
jgi:hypothetical protein